MDRVTRRQAPEVDTRGYRPGHPRSDASVSAAVAAAKLNTSNTTVRALVDSGEIDGYWRLAGSRFRYFVYEGALDAFVGQHGSFPGARSRRRGTRPSPGDSSLRSEAGRASEHADILARLDRQSALIERSLATVGASQARLLALEDAVQRLARSNAHLKRALSEQAEASRLSDAASSARHRALSAILAASEEEGEIASALGLPDFPPAP